MIIVREKATKLVIFSFEDSAVVELSASGLSGDTLAICVDSENHEIVEGVVKPPFWCDMVLSYDSASGWAIADESNILKSLEEIKAEMNSEIYEIKTAIRKGYFTHSGITVNIEDALPMLQVADNNPIPLRQILTKDGVAAELTPTQITDFLSAMIEYVQTESETKGFNKVNAVNAATAFSELPMDIHSDWPVDPS
jgi:hypothetical protein